MTPSARLQSAIEILGELDKTGLPADRFIRDWFRMRRYAGSKDRAAVAERVYSILRHRASLAWRMDSDEPRALAIASALGEGANIDSLFTGDGYGAALLSDAERAAVAAPLREPAPLHVQGEFPAWLESELARSLGDALILEMRAMCERASVDLRANTLKTTRDEMLRELREQGFAAELTPYAPNGLRIASGEKLSLLSRSAAFEQGQFEFQDEAAQIASLLCAARPGERILDLAAGAGGKALALAAAMTNRGEVVACDTDWARLAQLAPRTLRAGATIIASHRTEGEPPQGPFDAVFVDAPCSGSGSWRRQPENKWRLTPPWLAALTVTQDMLLEQAASRAPGRIVYATCSLLNYENEDRVAAFLARHTDFRLRPAADVWKEVTNQPPPPGMGDFFKASPRTTQTDGFFAAILMRVDKDEASY